MNPADLKRGIDTAVEAVVADLKKKAKPISTREELKQVRVQLSPWINAP